MLHNDSFTFVSEMWAGTCYMCHTRREWSALDTDWSTGHWNKYSYLIGPLTLCSDWLPGEADGLLEGGVLGVDQVGEQEQVLGAGDGVTLATLRDLLLLHS